MSDKQRQEKGGGARGEGAAPTGDGGTTSPSSPTLAKAVKTSVAKVQPKLKEAAQQGIQNLTSDEPTEPPGQTVTTEVSRAPQAEADGSDAMSISNPPIFSHDFPDPSDDQKNNNDEDDSEPAGPPKPLEQTVISNPNFSFPDPPEPSSFRPVEEYFNQARFADNTQTRFVLQILGDDRFFEVAEVIIDNDLTGRYVISTTIVADDHLPAQELLGQQARIAIHGGHGDADEKTNYFHGEFDEIIEAGHSGRRVIYKATLYSPLKRLDYTTDCRVFKFKRSYEIIQFYLEQVEIPYALELIHGHNVIDYLVQYDETDLNCILRVAQRYGLFFIIRNAEDGLVVVITDDSCSQARNAAPYEIEFKPDRGMAYPSKRYVSRLNRNFARKAQSWYVNEFDLARPKANLEISAKRVSLGYAGASRRGAQDLSPVTGAQSDNFDLSVLGPAVASRLLSYTAMLSRKRAAELFGDEAPTEETTEADDISEDTLAPKSAQFRRYTYTGLPIGTGCIQADLFKHRQETLADIMLAAENVKSNYINGCCNDMRLFAGFTFNMIDHPDPSANDVYFVIRARHVGKQPQVLEEDLGVAANTSKGTEYVCEFEAVVGLVSFKSEAVAPWPKISGVQIAEVWCPEGEVVHVDARGRIQVYFYWDHHRREEDQRQSCWVDISRATAGSGSSTVTPPRHRDKAIVAYHNGDPDQPCVLGFVPSATTMPNHGLGADQHKFRASWSGRVIGSGKDELSNEFSMNDDPDQPELKDRAVHTRTSFVGKHKREVCAVGETDVAFLELLEFVTMFVFPLFSKSLECTAHTALNQLRHPDILNGTAEEEEELENISPESVTIFMAGL